MDSKLFKIRELINRSAEKSTLLRTNIKRLDADVQAFLNLPLPTKTALEKLHAEKVANISYPELEGFDEKVYQARLVKIYLQIWEIMRT